MIAMFEFLVQFQANGNEETLIQLAKNRIKGAYIVTINKDLFNDLIKYTETGEAEKVELDESFREMVEKIVPANVPQQIREKQIRFEIYLNSLANMDMEEVLEEDDVEEYEEILDDIDIIGEQVRYRKQMSLPFKSVNDVVRFTDILMRALFFPAIPIQPGLISVISREEGDRVIDPAVFQRLFNTTIVAMYQQLHQRNLPPQ